MQLQCFLLSIPSLFSALKGQKKNHVGFYITQKRYYLNHVGDTSIFLHARNIILLHTTSNMLEISSFDIVKDFITRKLRAYSLLLRIRQFAVPSL